MVNFPYVRRCRQCFEIKPVPSKNSVFCSSCIKNRKIVGDYNRRLLIFKRSILKYQQTLKETYFTDKDKKELIKDLKNLEKSINGGIILPL